ncbi:MAG: uroporphyrinogen-III synthase, partial [Gammaproteobacteria bacterium]
QQINNKTIIIFGGKQPRPLLAEQLQQRGATVIHASCYERLPIVNKLDPSQQIHVLNQVDVIVCTSNDILLNLIHQFDNDFRNRLFDKDFLVFNQQMHAILRQAGYTKSPIFADNPTNHSIMSALTFWYEDYRHE